MLNVFLRAIIIYVVIVIVFRVMGRRQIGEMEPYELVVTLIIAEVACVPMADKSIPITWGLISVVAVLFMHQLSILVSKNAVFQSMISGKTVLIIDRQGINHKMMRSLSMQVNDVLQAMRAAGYFSIEQINYALFETNGQLSVIPRPEDEVLPEIGVSLPFPVILDGKWSAEDMKKGNIDKEKVEGLLRRKRINPKKVLLLTIDTEGRMFMQETGKAYAAETLEEDVFRK
jgi:uncharacterized membrane protein YcaP (DUF421 family)